MSTIPLVQAPARRRSIRFLGMVIALCLLAAVATLGVRSLLTSVGSAKHMRYEPVDVPPQEVSPSSSEGAGGV